MAHTTWVMKPSPVSLVGSRLCFDPSGAVVVAIEPDAIEIADLRAGKTHRLTYPHVCAVVAFADQLWIATSDECLARSDFAGRALGDPIALPFAATGAFVPAPCGPPAAVWTSTPAVALFDDLGVLRQVDASDADATFPLTARRHLTARGSRLTLPSGSTVALPPGTTALGGVVMAAGNQIVVLVAGAGGRQLLAISIGTAQVVQRCAVGTGIVRVATRRGLLVAQTAPAGFEVIDVRSGRMTATFELAYDVLDLAIDPDAHRCVIRGASGTIEVCELAELLRARAPVAEVPEAAGGEASQDASDTEWGDVAAEHAPVAARGSAPADVDDIASALVIPTLHALSPRTVRPAIARSVALGHLERELRSVSLWLLAAFARGFDVARRVTALETEDRGDLELERMLAFVAVTDAAAVPAAHDRREQPQRHRTELALEVAQRDAALDRGSDGAR